MQQYTQIETGKATLLVVPIDQIPADMFDSNKDFWSSEEFPSQWEIVGRSNDVTEEQAEPLVEYGISCAICQYYCGNSHHHNNWFYTESPLTVLHSLLQSHGFYEENPCGKEPNIDDYYTKNQQRKATSENDFVDFRYDEHQWLTAEKNVNPLILVKR